VYDLRNITKEELCPIVYIKTTRGWKLWQADEGDEFEDVDIEDDLSWIDPSIRKFITENADEQKADHKSLVDSLAKPTLYWAAVNDTDFVSGEKLKLKSIGRTQVYVGKANNGIQGRWIKDANNHCTMMKKCLDNMCAMTTYDPLRLEGIQLVDARLALANVREEKTALFVIKTFGDGVEKSQIAQQKIEKRLDKVEHILKNKTFRRVLPRARFNEFEEEKTLLQNKLDKEIAVISRLKRSKISKSVVEAQLIEAEKLHRKGKRVPHKSHKNIIPFDDYNLTWEPTNMRYGMNCN
jgi:hypothetical protein